MILQHKKLVFTGLNDLLSFTWIHLNSELYRDGGKCFNTQVLVDHRTINQSQTVQIF